MCKLLIAIKMRQDANAELATLLSLQRATILSQPDGIASFAVRQDNELELERKLDAKEYPAVFDSALANIPNAKILALHSRFATAGKVSQDNIHFFEDNGLYFAHNGWLNTGESYKKEYLGKYIYPEVKAKAHADSKEFLFKLAKLKKLTPQKIKNLMAREKFEGVATLIDPKNQALYLLGERAISFITDYLGYIAFFSYHPDVSKGVWRRFAGLDIWNDAPAQFEVQTLEKGVYRFSYKDNEMKITDSVDYDLPEPKKVTKFPGFQSKITYK